MVEYHEWRLETYQEAMDPFGTIQFYVMQGNVMIAQCEIEAHAALIISERERLLRYQQALEQIAGMSAASHDLGSAVTMATEALRGPV